MPSFRQLRNFAIIAEVESLSKAAILLGVVPSALSAQLSALEREFGCELVRRDGRGVHPTQYGLELLYRGRKVLRALHNLESEMKDFGKNVDGQISVGLLPSLVGDLVSPLFTLARTRFPRIQLSLREGHGGDLVQALASGQVDLATLYKHQVHSDYASTPLFTEDLFLAGRAGSDILRHGAVDFHAITRLPLIISAPHHGLRFLLDSAGAGIGHGLNIVAEVDSIAGMRILLADGFAFGIVPRTGFEGDIAASRIGLAPIRNPSVSRSIVLAQPVQLSKAAALSAISGLILELIASPGRHGRAPPAGDKPARSSPRLAAHDAGG